MYKAFLWIGIWFVVSVLLMGADVDYSAPLLPQLLVTMLAVALAVPACYIAAYRLTPKYLYTKKSGKYIGFMWLLVFANSFVTYLVSFFLYQLLSGISILRTTGIAISVATLIFVYNIMLTAVSCAIKIITDRFRIEQRLEESQKEKTETELNFLRSQVNPHFLFNLLNTIYFQIEQNNVPARESLEKLSEMLRYQLYECTTDRVEISSEIEYIRNYVAMQSLRMEKGTDIRLSIDEKLSGFAIAPLLILPLIENAFKHISHFKDPADNKIHISLRRAVPSFLIVDVLNSFEPAKTTNHILPTGGLGIPNLLRRLDLLYPKRHEYSDNIQGNIYETVLKINYHD